MDGLELDIIVYWATRKLLMTKPDRLRQTVLAYENGKISA